MTLHKLRNQDLRKDGLKHTGDSEYNDRVISDDTWNRVDYISALLDQIVKNTEKRGFSFPPQKIRLPFTTWVMSHILSNVVSCHSYDLRIVRHLQQPCQDPVEKKKQGKSSPNFENLSSFSYWALKKKIRSTQHSIWTGRRRKLKSQTTVI